MVSAVAAIAVQLAGVLEQHVSGDVLVPKQESWGYIFGTKTWYGSSNGAYNAETCGGAAMGKPWPHLGCREYCACADICKLVVTALELFQTLTTKARQAGTSAEGAGVLLLTSICCFAEMHVTF